MSSFELSRFSILQGGELHIPLFKAVSFTRLPFYSLLGTHLGARFSTNALTPS